MRGSKPMFGEKRINAVYHDTWMEYGLDQSQTFGRFVETRAMELTTKNALTAVLLASARRHAADIRGRHIRGDLSQAEGLVEHMEAALERVEMSRDLVTAAALLMDAANLLLEGHERKAWAETREARQAARGE